MRHSKHFQEAVNAAHLKYRDSGLTAADLRVKIAERLITLRF
jgi:hypothetical protein